jgi:hypothetical protein
MSTRSVVSSSQWSGAGGAPLPRWLSSSSSVPTDTTETEVEKPVAPVPVLDLGRAETTSERDELKNNLKPSEIVAALDLHIVGQQDAKKAVAIAMRNRWRRRQLPEELRKEVTPRNVLLVGPTGGSYCVVC